MNQFLLSVIIMTFISFFNYNKSFYLFLIVENREESIEQDWLVILLKYPFQDRLLSECWNNSFIVVRS